MWRGVSGQDTSTTTECQPVAPLGTVPTRLSVWVTPVRSVARTSRVWLPEVAYHSHTHWRQVSRLSSAASRAVCHGPPSTRTSTREIPRCWAQATPATGIVPGFGEANGRGCRSGTRS